jgi:A/G-specific adenine glycosylase
MNPDAYHVAVLAWYDQHRRSLPWRAEEETSADPYAVWLSEIMLQQTTVATVRTRFEAFIRRWPTVADLAQASLDEILVQWQGLGYYARARNLHKCAVVIWREHHGVFPAELDELLALPGIGPYTAAAIAAIAFDRPVVPVDGNIERIVARLFSISAPLPGAKPQIAKKAGLLTEETRPGDFAQALMDLGAAICRPKAPHCQHCPLQHLCSAAAGGDPSAFPAKTSKPSRPHRRGTIFWLQNDASQVLLQKRPSLGLLGGMTEFPSTNWQVGPWPGPDEISAAAPLQTDWRETAGYVEHTFTHFKLSLRAQVGHAEGPLPSEMFWVHPDDLAEHALPTVMKKVAHHVLAERLRGTGPL